MYFGRKHSDAENKNLIISSPSKGPETEFSVIRVGTDAKEKILDIKFDMSKLTQQGTPKLLAKQTVNNINSPIKQTRQLKFTETISTMKSFEWGFHFGMSVGTTFSVGIPSISEAGISVEVETGFNLGGAESTTKTRTYEDTQPIVCPACSTCVAEAKTMVGVIDVPYVATIERTVIDGRHREQKFKFTIPGEFKNTEAYDFQYVIRIDKHEGPECKAA